MDKIRMRFKKTGRAIYISHLDLMQTMQRAFNRAEYKIKYSEGFNPHPTISIALPLSVGASSVCEIMDFVLTEEVNLNELPARLNAVLPEGIEVIEAYPMQRKVAQLKWLLVNGVFEYDDRDVNVMSEKLSEFYSANEIVITKKTKRGMGETDIRPGIKEIHFEAGEKLVKVTAVISAQEPTINPDLLSNAVSQKAPEIAPDFAKFTRMETYDMEMQVYR